MSIAKIFASQENVKMILYHTKRLLKKPYYHFTERIFTDVIAKAREIYSQNILMIKLTFFTKIYMKKMGMMVSICKQLLMKITAVKTIMIYQTTVNARPKIRSNEKVTNFQVVNLLLCKTLSKLLLNSYTGVY